MDIFEFLKTTSEMEIKMGELYLWFSKEFGWDKEASAVFRKMSQEEKAMYDMLEYERRQIARARRSFKGVEIGPYELPNIPARVEALLNSSVEPSLEEAVKLSLGFEKCAAEIHCSGVLIRGDGKIAQVMVGLAEKNSWHANELVEFAQKRGWQLSADEKKAAGSC